MKYEGSPDSHRCGYVALAGRPNVGKSTLLNALVGQHLSVVSPKAQTTRDLISGIVSTEEYQIVFLDAPGLFEPRTPLQEAMRWAAQQALEESDAVVLVSDATRPSTLPGAEMEELSDAGGRGLVVAVNKADQADADTVSRLVSQVQLKGYRTVATSATQGTGLAELVEMVISLLPESPPLFPAEYSATRPVRFFAQEFVRETCMERFRDEIPYGIACRVDEFREEQDPVYVAITIFVERESQKGIVIGRGGAAIREVGRTSREKIEGLIGRPVYLDLRVKVLAGWSRKRNRLRQLGFRLPPAGGSRR